MLHRHRALDLALVLSIFKTGSTLKRRNALGFDFTALTHLCFSVALYMYILALVVSFVLTSNRQNYHRFFLKSLKQNGAEQSAACSHFVEVLLNFIKLYNIAIQNLLINVSSDFIKLFDLIIFKKKGGGITRITLRKI